MYRLTIDYSSAHGPAGHSNGVSPYGPGGIDPYAAACEGHRHQGDRSQHPSHHITSQQSRQQYPAQVEYQSASWR